MDLVWTFGFNMRQRSVLECIPGLICAQVVFNTKVGACIMTKLFWLWHKRNETRWDAQEFTSVTDWYTLGF